MSTAEAADVLGLRTRTLYRLIDEGQLPAYRFGRVIRLRRSDLDAFIDRCRIEPGSLDHLYPDGSCRQLRDGETVMITSSTSSSDT